MRAARDRVLRRTTIALPMVPTLLGAAILLVACSPGSDENSARHVSLPPMPAEFQEGEQHFNATCASCHGEGARGTRIGPPLVHKVYEPGHHSDAAFLLAVRNGVTAHHWRFGNMPPQPNVTGEQTEKIVAYVRWLQRQAGID